MIKNLRIFQIYEEKPRTLTPYIAFSLIVHLLFLLLVYKEVNIPAMQEKTITVFPVTEGESGYEIADIAQPAVEKVPKKAKYLGMYNSSVDEQTVARPRPPGEKKQAGGELSRQSPKPVLSKKDLYDLDRTLFAMKTPQRENHPGTKGDLGPQFREDFYPDYKFGDHTYLNVLRYPDVDYFVRMKRQFRMTFNPAPVLRGHFVNNRISVGSVEVALAVTVDKNGNLSELFVLKSSGIAGYDHEAMRTVKASSPFASPPDKFLANDGVLRMSWVFTVYL